MFADLQQRLGLVGRHRLLERHQARIPLTVVSTRSSSLRPYGSARRKSTMSAR